MSRQWLKNFVNCSMGDEGRPGCCYGNHETFLLCFQQISRLNQEVSQLSRELRQVMGLLQARLGPPSHPAGSAWLPDLPCSHQRPPCIAPHMSGPPSGLQNTTLAVVHCPASVGTVEIGASPSELRPSMMPPYPSEPDPLGPSPVPEASPLTPSLLKHSFQSGSDTFH